MRRFHIYPRRDGGGATVAAQGVLFDHGMVVVHFVTKPTSTQMFRSMADMIEVMKDRPPARLVFQDGEYSGSLSLGAEPEEPAAATNLTADPLLCGCA